MCQGMGMDEWIDKQQENVLDTTYFHTVFTIPDELNPIVYSNQELLYDALYMAVNRTLRELAANPKYLGARIGYICVLHTWGSKMNYHPHIHTIVQGGGLDDKNHWKDKGDKLFFPYSVMKAKFKEYYLTELKRLHDAGKLTYAGSSEKYRNSYDWKALLDKLYKSDWVVHKKEAFNGAQSVINYLGRYTHRIAISNRRIVSIDGDNVTYKAKDYENAGKQIEVTVPGVEFIRKFLMHVLPKGFVKIRHYGLLASRIKKEKMTLCRNILGCKQYISQLRDKTVAEKLEILYKVDICKCRECGEPVRSYAVRGAHMLC